MYILKEINPNVSNFNGDPEILKPILFYNEDIYITRIVKGYPKKIRQIKKHYLISKNGTFLSGFLPKIIEYLNYKKIKFKFIPYKTKTKIKIQEPKLKGIKFRNYQKENIEILLKTKRGVYVEPTGGGKTIIMAGLMSCFNDPSVVLVQTTALFNQTYKELCSFFGKNKVGKIGAGKKDIKQYNIAMVQTLKNLKINKHYFKIVIVDETHHANKINGMYAKALDKIHAPYRIGLTATEPTKENQKLILEGLIGKIITKITYEEHIEAGILAKPKLYLLMAPENKKAKNLKGKYLDRYEKGIVKFKGRNELIMLETMKQIDKGNTVLILVERIEHGKELMKFAEILLGKNKGIFLHGQTDKEVKTQIQKAKRNWLKLKKEKDGLTLDLTTNFDKTNFKKKLKKAENKFKGLSKKAKNKLVESMRQKFEKKKIPYVIATRIWAEGINIKSVNVVINAVGGQSEKAVIQRFGRGMRITDEKDTVLLIDIIDADTHVDFMKHSMKRIVYYYKAGWINTYE